MVQTEPVALLPWCLGRTMHTHEAVDGVVYDPPLLGGANCLVQCQGACPYRPDQCAGELLGSEQSILHVKVLQLALMVQIFCKQLDAAFWAGTVVDLTDFRKTCALRDDQTMQRQCCRFEQNLQQRFREGVQRGLGICVCLLSFQERRKPVQAAFAGDRRKQGRFTAEVVVEGLFGDAGRACNRLHAGVVETLFQKDMRCGRDDSGLLLRAAAVDPVVGFEMGNAAQGWGPA